MTSYPLVRRTFATLRIAEFGFLGVRVMTCVQTPRRKGFLRKAGDLLLAVLIVRGLRTSWLIVGITVGSNLEKAQTVELWISTASFFWKET